MRTTLLPILTASLLLSCAALADEPSPSARILIRAGHVVEVHSGKEAADLTIIVSGDRIVDI